MRGAVYPPGPSTPRVWQFLRSQTDPVNYFERCAARYGDVFTLRGLADEPFVVATGPDEVQAILTDQERFAGGDAAKLIEPVIGPASVILRTGPGHMRQRKLLLPSFHGERIGRWSERIAQIAREQTAGLPIGVPVATRPVMQRIALEVICRVVFGMDDRVRIVQFSSALTRMMDPRLAPLLFLPGLLRRRGRLSPGQILLRRRALVHRLVLEEVARRRADPQRASRDDVLSSLIESRDENGEALRDAELRDELMGLLIAGHETTATGLSWALERLSRTPRARERLSAELAAGERAYLEAVVRETLRCRPPIIDAVRTTVLDTELGGHALPAGTLVSAMFCVTQRRADLFAEPLAFRPERFLEGKPAPYSYVPFGGGVRRCIGASLAVLEMQVVLETVVQSLRVLPAPGSEEAIRAAGIVLIPARGGRVVLEPAPARGAATTGAAEAAPVLG